MLKGKCLIDPMDFSLGELDEIFNLADSIIADPGKYAEVCKGKLLATCFYEPSTRTRLSFEAAMHRLGGSVIGFSSAGSSSASKGESVADTIRTIGCYADIAAMRHPKEGAAKIASVNSPIPVINAGDGGHQHPTQTLTDLLTIRSLKGSLNNFIISAIRTYIPYLACLKYTALWSSSISTEISFTLGNGCIIIKSFFAFLSFSRFKI